MTDTKYTIAELIREHRERSGDTVTAIAAKTGLSRIRIGQLSHPSTKTVVQEGTLKKLSEGLGIPLATLRRAAAGTAGGTDARTLEDSPLLRITERLKEFSPKELELAADVIETLARHRFSDIPLDDVPGEAQGLPTRHL